MNPVFKLNIRRGLIDNLGDFKVWLFDCAGKSKDGVYDLSFKRHRERREKTTEQLGYLFGCVYKIISDYSGDDTMSTHLFCKHKFGRHEDVGGKMKPVSISEYSTMDLCEYIDKIKPWFFNFSGISIPEPERVEL